MWYIYSMEYYSATKRNKLFDTGNDIDNLKIIDMKESRLKNRHTLLFNLRKTLENSS